MNLSGSELTTIWLGLLTLAGIVLPIMLAQRQTRKEEQAEKRSNENAAATTAQQRLIDDLQDEVELLRKARVEDAQTINNLHQEFRGVQAHVTTLERQVGQLESQIVEWEKGIKLLTGQIRDNGLDPVWEPTKEEST